MFSGKLKETSQEKMQQIGLEKHLKYSMVPYNFSTQGTSTYE